ncbi:MAG: hypothetical protein ACI8S6_005928 [Myxococcota bacterium]|jgi:hypothetical protein
MGKLHIHGSDLLAGFTPGSRLSHANTPAPELLRLAREAIDGGLSGLSLSDLCP